MLEYSSGSGEALPEVDLATYAPDATPLSVVLPDQFAHLPLALIAPSLTNPRKTFDAAKLAELAESIKASGVHQPILVRPLPGSRVEETSWEPRSLHRRAVRPTHEIIAGERRYRAATLAGLSTIPAMIRAMTDDQVLECQLVENLQRDDLSPLEEAEGYEHLCAATGISKDDVGAKIGKSRAYVYARIKLLDLAMESKQALREGKIDASRALLIARIPDGKLQLKALAYATEIEAYSKEPHSVRGLKEWLKNNVMLKLEHAVFKLTDARLVEAAGSCTDCPKRTGANPDLFADVDGADICTDPPCYHAKEAAHRAALIRKAEAKGMRIVEGKEALELMNGNQFRDMPDDYVSLSTKRQDLTPEGERPATLGQLLGKDAPAPILFIHPRTQAAMELVPEPEAEAVLLAKGLIKTEEKRAERLEDLSRDLERLQKRAKADTDTACHDALTRATAMAIKVTSTEQARQLLSPEVLRAMLMADVDDYGEDHTAEVLGYEFQDGEDELAAITGHIQRMGDADLHRAAALRMLSSSYANSDGPAPMLDAFVKQLGLDTKAIQRTATNKVKGEYAQRIRELQARIDAQKSPLPLASAAQAEGGGGAKAQSQNPKSPAAPARKSKMSAPEAQAAIAAAMQGQNTDTGAADASQGLEAVSGCALPVGVPAPAILGEIDPAQYATAVNLVVIQRRASISHVQRMLGIGYNAAARMIERMETEGIVGPMRSDGGRDVLQPSPIQPTEDPQFDSALAIIIRDQKASVRQIKNELKVGTTRALELMDKLAQAGKVSACDERGARKVLVTA